MNAIVCIESIAIGISAGLVIASALSIFLLDFLRDPRRPKRRRIEPSIGIQAHGNGMNRIELTLAQQRMQMTRIRRAIAYYRKNPSEKLKRDITLAMEALQINLQSATR